MDKRRKNKLQGDRMSRGHVSRLTICISVSWSHLLASTLLNLSIATCVTCCPQMMSLWTHINAIQCVTFTEEDDDCKRKCMSFSKWCGVSWWGKENNKLYVLVCRVSCMLYQVASSFVNEWRLFDWSYILNSAYFSRSSLLEKRLIRGDSSSLRHSFDFSRVSLAKTCFAALSNPPVTGWGLDQHLTGKNFHRSDQEAKVKIRGNQWMLSALRLPPQVGSLPTAKLPHLQIVLFLRGTWFFILIYLPCGHGQFSIANCSKSFACEMRNRASAF